MVGMRQIIAVYYTCTLETKKCSNTHIIYSTKKNYEMLPYGHMPHFCKGYVMKLEKYTREVISPHVCDVSGVIVLTSSVRLSVGLLPLSRPDGQT